MTRTASATLLGHLHTLTTASSATDLPDRELLLQFTVARDESAFTMLLRRHGPLVLGVCRRVLPNEQDAEDAFQATFLALARSAHAIHKRESVSCWLHSVARRVALRLRRSTLRRIATESRIDHHEQADPLAEISVRELLRLVDEEVQTLPEACRLAVLLCHLQGQSQEEAARQLGWPRGTLKGRLERGRELLRVRLARRGITLPAAFFVTALARQSRACVPASLQAATVRAVLTPSSPAALRTRIADLAGAAVPVARASRMKAMALLLTGLSILAGYRLAAVGEERLATPSATPPPDNRPTKANTRTPTTDRYGDALPHGAFARMGTVRFRTGGPNVSLAYSPDGKTLASATSHYGAFILWEAATGKQLRRFEVYRAPANTVAFSSDGKILAGLGGDGSITLWDTASAKEIFHLHDIRTVFTCFALAPGGKILAAGGTDATRNKGFLRLYSTETRKVIREMNGETVSYFRTVVFAPDGKTLAAGSEDKTVRVWDVGTGKEQYRLATSVSWGNSLAFSPDGKILASVGGHGGVVNLWNSHTGKELRRLAIPRMWMWSLAFSPDGKRLAAAGTTVYLWDVDSGKEVRQVKNVSASSVAFSPNGRTLAVGCDEGAIRFWDVETGKERFPDAGHTGGIWSSVPSPDGRLLATACRDGSVRLWEVRTGREVRSLTADGPAILRVDFSPSGKMLASAGAGGEVVLWETNTGTEVGRLKGHKKLVNAVVFSPDGGILATASRDEKTVRLWEVITRKELRRLEGQWVEAVAWSPDGKLLACGSLDVDTGREKLIRIVEAATGKELRRFEGGQVRSLAFSPDGKLLASSGHADAVRLWDVATGKEIRRLERLQKELWNRDVFCVGFSPDGRMIASAEADGICLWEVSTGELRRQLKGHQGFVYHVAFSAGGKVLLSSGTDTTALAWNTFASPRDRMPIAKKLSAKVLESAWADLGGRDAARAFDAACVLLAVPEQAVNFLRERLPPVRATDTRRMDRLMADLGSARFATRRRAMEELEQLGESAVPALRRALQESLPLELKRRIEQLLESQEPKRRVALRALEVLEHASGAARSVLERIAEGAAESPITQEAKAAVQRLRRG